MCTNDLGSGFSCKCLDVFRGTRCERKLKPCDAKPCKNQGICKDLAKNGENWFDCGCKEGYGGKLCQYLYGRLIYIKIHFTSTSIVIFEDSNFQITS